MTMFAPEIIAAAQAHARDEFPKESCGLIVGDEYVRCFNYAVDPLNDFKIAPEIFVRASEKGEVRAVVHSHPNGPLHPTRTDMQSQIDTALPWIIIPLDDERVGPPIIWGDQVPMAPLIGRQFMHGVADCYTLVRDCFRLGRDGMAAQDMPDWPYPPIELPEFPRDDDWWNLGQNLYEDALAPLGFKPISVDQVRPGDGFLMKVRSDKLNHAGVVVGNDLILHHLPTRLSRREPAGLWARGADLWVRYEGPGRDA